MAAPVSIVFSVPGWMMHSLLFLLVVVVVVVVVSFSVVLFWVVSCKVFSRGKLDVGCRMSSRIDVVHSSPAPRARQGRRCMTAVEFMRVVMTAVPSFSAGDG